MNTCTVVFKDRLSLCSELGMINGSSMIVLGDRFVVFNFSKIDERMKNIYKGSEIYFSASDILKRSSVHKHIKNVVINKISDVHGMDNAKNCILDTIIRTDKMVSAAASLGINRHIIYNMKNIKSLRKNKCEIIAKIKIGNSLGIDTGTIIDNSDIVSGVYIDDCDDYVSILSQLQLIFKNSDIRSVYLQHGTVAINALDRLVCLGNTDVKTSVIVPRDSYIRDTDVMTKITYRKSIVENGSVYNTYVCGLRDLDLNKMRRESYVGNGAVLMDDQITEIRVRVNDHYNQCIESGDYVSVGTVDVIGSDALNDMHMITV